MLHASGLPKTLWGEALLHIVWVKNGSATRALDGKTPYEMLYGKKPHLGDLPVWGAKCWILDRTGSKLDDRAKEGHWVGYNSELTAHRIYLPIRKAVIAERNVTFQKEDGMVSSRLEGENVTGENSYQLKPTKSVNENTPPVTATAPSNQSLSDHLGPNLETPPDRALRHSSCQRTESLYIQMLQSGVGTHNG